jgi:hypothetical protein
MDLTNSEAMARLAEDVREQAGPFSAAAAEAFSSVFVHEYHRLRAAALESGQSSATLNCVVRCNFDPRARSVEIVTRPEPTAPRPRRRAIALSR